MKTFKQLFLKEIDNNDYVGPTQDQDYQSSNSDFGMPTNPEHIEDDESITKEREFRKKFFDNLQRVINYIAKEAGEIKKYTIANFGEIPHADARNLSEILYHTADDEHSGMMDEFSIAEMDIDKLVKVGNAINDESRVRVQDILMSDDGIFDGCDEDLRIEHTPEINR